MDVVILFDGLIEPANPGGCGAWGYALWLGTKQRIEEFGSLGNPPWMTNNYIEYCALGFALKKMIELQLPEIKSLTILGDSQLVINHLNDVWQTKSESLLPLKNKCIEYLDSLKVDWIARWIPRDINQLADELSRKGYAEWKSKTNK